ncbi:PREDICTED: transcription factor MYB1R1-like isoform X2 [Ipomoea nil]|uniref:transcription factor MYB1R1-like isoform X2 n=1 Tax=Ipomoea nil TaxID=35883 RepID=UPI000900A908|nr:PREDICTED: transcription factor MYB1R1-like isoform X2 [Ipomoea nil]
MAALCRSQYVSLRTCGDSAANDSAVDGAGGAAEIMLFGVRVKVDPMRKSVSLNNLSQYEQPNNTNKNNESAKNSPPPPPADEGYASADDAVLHQPSSGRERKRGVPWTEEEHKLFLLGLQKVGKGDWRGISRNFVKTRTPTQVASHAQKYFLRRSNLNRRRRRSSLFDITTDSVTPMSTAADVKAPQENSTLAEPSRINPFSVSRIPVTVAPVLQPVQVEEKKPIENLAIARTDEVNNPISRFICPVTTNPSARIELNLNQGMDTEPSFLSLSLSLSVNQSPSSSSRHPIYPGMSSFNNGDTTIIVS